MYLREESYLKLTVFFSYQYAGTYNNFNIQKKINHDYD